MLYSGLVLIILFNIFLDIILVWKFFFVVYEGYLCVCELFIYLESICCLDRVKLFMFLI